MCGICGFINLDNSSADPFVIRDMTNSLAHRGPDNQNIYIEENLAIGHTRLSILDLSQRSNQPMISENKRFILSYNGEVYNYLKLKNELIAKGYTFFTQSDTEVVLKSLIEWNEEALLKFNGMFAIAFYDKHNKSLLIARDRYGIKPLYYSLQKNFFFASEIKSILKNKSFSKKIDLEGLYEYFTFQNIISDKTFFKDINLLKPGFFLRFEKEKNIILRQYWDFKFSNDNMRYKNYDQYKENFGHLFDKSIKNHLNSDVKIGSYLSGGIDSGLISKVSSSYINNLDTFTCGFKTEDVSERELKFDEREQAKKLSNLIKSSHHEEIIYPEDIENTLKKIVFHLEEPRVGQCYPNYIAARTASKNVKVVLSGTGGDEIFGGYPWRYLYNQNFNSFDDFINNYYTSWHRLVNNQNLNEMFSPIYDQIKHIWTIDIFRDVFKNFRSKDSLTNCLYFESKTFLHGLLVVEDKLSMAHGLETRLPFLDNDLVEFSLTCPNNFKIRNIDFLKKNLFINNNRNDGKMIVRDYMSSILPNEIINRDKQGFSSPDESWFRGEIKEYVKSILFNKKSKIYDYLNYLKIIELINEHFNGHKNRRLLIWSLLYFDCWLQEFNF